MKGIFLMNVDILEFNNKYCKGCPGYIIDRSSVLTGNIDLRICSYAKYNEEGNCPCTECIVKPMCVDSCEDYNTFKSNVDSVGL